MNLEQCVMIAELVASLGVVVSIVYLAVQVRTRSTCARASALSRGSCTSGLRANGAILPGLEYRAMIGNNLSQLGVHGTFSTEDRQAQPDTEGFENSQIRLSDGTRLFSEDPFGVGVNIDELNYPMVAVNGGAKYQGFSVDAEAYFRKLDDFKATGTLPFDEITDHGFEVQDSAMVISKKLQAILQYSKIFGDQGDPWDFTAGAFWYPFGGKEMRVNGQALYLHGSPAGYSSVPFAVGGTGWVFSIDVAVAHQVPKSVPSWVVPRRPGGSQAS
jgi:hypothetical protein